MDRRMRTLTEAGKEQFEKIVMDFVRQLKTKRDIINANIDALDSSEIENVLEVSDNLLKNCRQYEEISVEFVAYLQRARCLEAERELSGHKMITSSLTERVQMAISNADARLREGEQSTRKTGAHIQTTTQTPKEEIIDTKSQKSKKLEKAHKSNKSSKSRHPSVNQVNHVLHLFDQLPANKVYY